MSTELMTFEMYRLPDGRVVPVDATASKGARTIGFTLTGGEVVTAVAEFPAADMTQDWKILRMALTTASNAIDDLTTEATHRELPMLHRWLERIESVVGEMQAEEARCERQEQES